jgi:hypothetical protein
MEGTKADAGEHDRLFGLLDQKREEDGIPGSSLGRLPFRWPGRSVIAERVIMAVFNGDSLKDFDAAIALKPSPC